jgi:uncharacterized membrane protein
MADQNTQTPPQAPVPPPVSGGVDNDKLMGILSYLGILILIPLLATKNRSASLNFHINQGLGLIIIAVIGWVVLSTIPSFYIYRLMNIWQLLILVLIVIGIINVTKGENKPLPVIGNWFKLIK